MKNIYSKLWVPVLVMISLGTANAQSTIESPTAIIIRSFPLPVTYNKTTNLIFSFEVKRVDLGSRDIIAQKPKGVDSVLQVKAAVKYFKPTNLTVFTADGKLYSFDVRYEPDPDSLNFSFIKDPLNILNQKHFLEIIARDEQMALSLNSIYINKQTLWFTFLLTNNSLIDFRPGYIKFFIADNRRIKRTAEQEIAIEPSFQTAFTAIPGHNKKQLVFGFPQFTLPKDKHLVCQISEQNGGRMLTLHLNHKTILKARLLP